MIKNKIFLHSWKILLKAAEFYFFSRKTFCNGNKTKIE